MYTYRDKAFKIYLHLHHPYLISFWHAIPIYRSIFILVITLPLLAVEISNSLKVKLFCVWSQITKLSILWHIIILKVAQMYGSQWEKPCSSMHFIKSCYFFTSYICGNYFNIQLIMISTYSWYSMWESGLVRYISQLFSKLESYWSTFCTRVYVHM